MTPYETLVVAFNTEINAKEATASALNGMRRELGAMSVGAVTESDGDVSIRVSKHGSYFDLDRSECRWLIAALVELVGES